MIYVIGVKVNKKSVYYNYPPIVFHFKLHFYFHYAGDDGHNVALRKRLLGT